MDIEQFVKDALRQISNAVDGSNEDSSNLMQINSVNGIDFDLAVTSTSENLSNTTASGGIKVRVVSGDVSKSGSKQNSHETTSRIKFNVVVQ